MKGSKGTYINMDVDQSVRLPEDMTDCGEPAPPGTGVWSLSHLIEDDLTLEEGLEMNNCQMDIDEN